MDNNVNAFFVGFQQRETMKKIANKNAVDYVTTKTPFRGNNLIGEWSAYNLYIVWSYRWWPLWVWDDKANIWLENADKYSTTTSKHRTQATPETQQPVAQVTKQYITHYINKQYPRLLFNDPKLRSLDDN